MPLSYRVDAARRLVEVKASGEVTLDDLREHFRIRAADPAFSPAYDALVDYRDVTRFVTPAELRSFAAEVPRWLGGMPSRRAIVATADVVYGTFRMLEAHTVDAVVQYRVFRDVDAARRWLADGAEV